MKSLLVWSLPILILILFLRSPDWTLVLMVRKRGRNLSARWENGRSFNRRKTEDLVEKAMESESPSAKVVNIVIKDKKQGRPIPLNTVNMLKACSKALGIGPHAAMQACERLYLQGYVSYPRTESTAYPKSFDIKGTLQQQANDARWGKYVRSLLQKGHTKARGGVDHGGTFDGVC
jgi:DNA topoisomerase III